ncbi:hypothetical protein V6N12_065299 [Hibiscus sabdariffa]|uniref:BHLH domain-containing protein n=1 Tax=Hibiscus sabdariffa TaxID=183260 RepID=A0ABR2G8A7_9ROSI
MEMMMQGDADKLPEFYGVYNDVLQLPHTELAGPTNVLGSPSPPPFINLPSTVSFAGSTPVQEPGFSSCPGSASGFAAPSQKKNSMAAMREMIFRIAAMQPIHIDPESVKPPKRRNVKISKDPQSVAARHRRERISERIRILQRLVPGGTKMDTASMLDEAIQYVKFLKSQVQSLERAAAGNRPTNGIGFPVAVSNGCSFLPYPQNLEQFGDAP